MGSKVKMIIVLDCNNNFLSYCTRDKAKALVKAHKGYFVADKTLKLKTSKSQEASKKRSVLREAKRICYICNRKIPEKEIATIDHVIPKSRDKLASCKYNMRCCCERCNGDKADRTLSEYVQHIKENRQRYTYISDKRLIYLEQYAEQYEKDYYNFYPRYVKQFGGNEFECKQN